MTPDILICGGGLAGASAAITLARAGKAVTLIERESQSTHKVCGEFLSREALDSLTALGLDVFALGAVPIQNVRIAGRRHCTASPLPFAAASLTRCVLDEALLAQAQQAGANILRGQRIDTLTPTATHWQARLTDGLTLAAPTAFLATGKHDLHTQQRPQGKQNDLVAFKMYWRLAHDQQQELAGHVELLLYRNGYAGLQPVESGAANLCCLIERSALRKLGGRWPDLLNHMQTTNPHLQRRLTGATPLLTRPLAISAIPYGYTATETQPNLWRLGDQAAVIPSFTGDGMSIALHTGRRAAEMYLAGHTAQAFQHELQTTVASQISFATTISRAMIHPLAQPAMEQALRLWPGALAFAAQRTRLRA
jgi:flavin-dependent dehydrogenase